MKTCTLCKQTKPYSDFTKHKQKKDGYNSWCKLCKRLKDKEAAAKRKTAKAIYDKEYREKNFDTITKRDKLYRENNKDKKAIYDKEYRIKKGQERLQQKRNYYHSSGKETAKLWRKNNPDKVKANMINVHSKRRALIKNSIVTSKDVQNWLNTQSKLCTYCGAFCPTNYQIDHIEPLSLGGKHELANLAISCPSCNQSKGPKQLLHWFAIKLTDRS